MPPIPRFWTALHMVLVLAASAAAQSPEWVKPSLPSLPSTRCCGSMAYDGATGLTVLFGGGNGGIYPAIRFNDTWTFSSTKGWSQLSPVTSPSPRQGAGIAYDPTTGTIVLFGGCPSWETTISDTWTWDGATWTQQFPPVSPPARVFDTQGMAYDAATETVVMFGGGFGDTWTWNGRTKTWTQKFPATSPPPSNATIAYDAASGKVVLFGGTDNQGSDLNQTWTWDGAAWTQQFPAASPSPRALPSMAYDWNTGKVVLFGGTAGPPSALNDTWNWNGTSWTQQQTSTDPPARWAAAMTFDPYLKGLILFGGELSGDPFANDTWLFKSQ